METNPFLTNKALKDFVSGLKISDEKKKILAERIPYLNEKERFNLLKRLTQIYLLELEEEEVIKKIKELIPE